MEAIATWRGGQPGVDVHMEIPYPSLSFMRSPTGFVATFATTVQVKSQEGEQLVVEREWVDSVNVVDYEVTQRFDTFTLSKRLQLEPGQYHIDVTIHDRTTNKARERSQEVSVFSVASGHPQLSPLWLERIVGQNETKPVVALHLPSNIGLLQCVSILYNAQNAGRLALHFVITRLASDTSVASPPYSFSPTQGSLAFLGIDYSRRDTVHTENRDIAGSNAEMPIVFRLPKLRRGIYLLDVKALEGGLTGMTDSTILRERFELAINAPNFPRPSTLDELTGALAYLVKGDELRAIDTASTEKEKRRQFELFWLKLGRTEQGAANLIKQYYSRVEDANLFFTTYKEGWKTDRGMIYIMMGPPLSVGSRLDEEYWYYSYNEQDPVSTFLFERMRTTNPSSLFQTYLLVRQPYYSTMWDRIVEKWRNGNPQ